MDTSDFKIEHGIENVGYNLQDAYMYSSISIVQDNYSMFHVHVFYVVYVVQSVVL